MSHACSHLRKLALNESLDKLSALPEVNQRRNDPAVAIGASVEWLKDVSEARAQTNKETVADTL